jgi:dihydroxyacetone kinase-like protein
MNMHDKFINDPSNIPNEAIEGCLLVSSNQIKRIGNGNVLVVDQMVKGKVGILIGGGMAAEPLFPGYVGKNMADCAVIGNINAAPSPTLILEGTRAINQNKGIIYIYNNYSGDILCFDMAEELAEEEGIQIRSVRVWDDAGSAPIEKISSRRGIVGAVLVIKVAGGASNLVDDLEELYRVTKEARDNTRSLIVVSRSGHYLENGEKMFDLPDGQIEIGVGLHGDPGFMKCEMMPVDKIVDIMMEKLLGELQCKQRDEIAILINSMGATSITELFIVNRRIDQIASIKGIKVHHTDIGYFYTSQDMVGFSISVIKLNGERKTFFDQPSNSFSYQRD